MITLDQLTKVFGIGNTRIVAADRVSMEVPTGEICILLGPSGCGKTTTLKMINRLIPKTSGRILIGGEDTDSLDSVTLRRTMGYVIQQVGLFPNMTVEENICVVPRLLKWDAAKARSRAAELLDLLALEPAVFLKRYPRQLSGGQQQRVGVARALAADPPVMIMDEPFGAVDPVNREIIQDQFLQLQKTLHKTVMFVSHDIDEAVKMGDKIALFRGGRLEQYDSPDNVLAHPANDFVSSFVGSDRTLKRLRLLHVRDAMEAAAPSVRVTDDVDRARRLMQEHGHDQIIVLDDQSRPVGRVSGTLIEGQRGHCRDVMQVIEVSVTPDDNLRTAVSRMFTHEMTCLPCIDVEGNLAGVLTQGDITHLLGRTHRVAAANRTGSIESAV